MTSHVDEKSTPPMIGRRAITRGAAWSVPVVALAVAAPAAAATSTNCTMGTLSWDTLRNGATGLGTFVTTINGLTATISATGATGATNNARVTKTDTGGLSRVLRFYDLDNVANTSQTITITFNKQVRNLSFSFLDVDSAISGGNRSYEDLVWITNPTTWSGTVHKNVIGSGTSAAPYRAKNTNSPVDGDSADSNVDLTFVGPLTTVSFVYGQDGSVNGDPFIGISDLTFQYCS
jgi:hypothetical protein